MGVLSKLFSKNIFSFQPDFSKTEHDNWLEYLSQGGTTEKWKILKKEHKWTFKPDPVEKQMKHEKEFRPVFNKYYDLINGIETKWSTVYHTKDYTCKLACEIEKECYEAIKLFGKLREIDLKYGETPMSGSKVFKRLAILYERQKNYEKSIAACKLACNLGINETARMKSMISKAGRDASREETSLMNSFQNETSEQSYSESENKITPANSRKSIPSEQIDTMQRIKASKHYCDKLYKMFYKGYPEMPFISQNRELNTNWIEQAQMFGVSPTKEMMTRYSDGLLPGHVYMLYWIREIHRKRIPVYFEYQYGINFTDEQDFLCKQGYLTSEMKVTKKGESAIDLHYSVIEDHKSNK